MTHHLFARMFQLGYVARDLDRALAAFSARYGETAFEIMDFRDLPPDQKPPTQRIALCYIDDMMLEIIEPDPARNTIYDDALSDDLAAIRLHHFGYLIDDYPATLRRLESLGYATPMHGSYGGALDYIYADTRADLGHFTEFIRLGEEGVARYTSLPRHSSK